MIILEILKWIGIVLLWLLLILLGLLLLVLFLPVRYYGEGTYNKEQLYALFKARWFWGLVRVKVTYPKKPYFSVKILWMELLKNQPGETATEEEAEKKPAPEKASKAGTNAAPEKASKAGTNAAPEKASKAETKPAEENAARKESKAAPEDAEKKKEPQEEPKTVPEDAPKEPFFDKWIGIKEKIQYYIEVFNERDTRDLLATCKVRILKMLKSIRPRKLKFRGTVGFSTPDTTGYLYGGYCMISSYLGKNVILTPDFENEIIDVTGSLKGHITVFVLAWNALRIYLDKRLMRLIAKLKKGGR